MYLIKLYQPFKILVFILMLSVISCTQKKANIDIPIPTKQAYQINNSSLSSTEYHDKILGALVGSAIGDAMGASTEMWHRSQIQKDYGYINGLTPAVREKSAEGTWDHNLGSGTTTDDTRWKLLMAKYFAAHHHNLSAENFAQFISDYYESVASKLSEKALQDPDELDKQLEKVNWIKEWHRVAEAYTESPEKFVDAKSRFYGGEMSCAGMLYTPVFGLFSGSPQDAYELAYEHSLFDIGYARDISALVAAMTNVAMFHDNMDSLLKVVDFVDPQGYKNSRLIGRLSESQAKTGVSYVKQALEMTEVENENIEVPTGYPGTNMEWMQQSYVYDMLEESQMPISFHAGEIWQILIAALEFGNGDFTKTMQFVVNYGRDNDTVAAVAGMILGAKVGYKNLPNELKSKTIQVNKELLGIDFEEMARDFVLKN